MILRRLPSAALLLLDAVAALLFAAAAPARALKCYTGFSSCYPPKGSEPFVEECAGATDATFVSARGACEAAKGAAKTARGIAAAANSNAATSATTTAALAAAADKAEADADAACVAAKPTPDQEDEDGNAVESKHGPSKTLSAATFLQAF